MQAGSQSWMVQAIAMNHAKEMSHWASRAVRPETSCLFSDPIRPRRRLSRRVTPHAHLFGEGSVPARSNRPATVPGVSRPGCLSALVRAPTLHGDTEPPDFLVQRGQRNLQALGGLGLVISVLFQFIQQKTALEALDYLRQARA